MRENNHPNDLHCAYAETLVAVLYGEATPAERKEFNKHYHDCSICREESVAFGSIRDAVAEWRTTDFDSAQTPAIVLPEIKNELISPKVKTFWSERVRLFLLPNAGKLQSATAFGALALCAVLLAVFSYALINRFAVREINVADVSNISRTNSVSSDPTPTPFETINPAPDAPPSPAKSVNSNLDASQKPTQSVIKPVARQNKPVIAQSSTRPSNKPVKTPEIKVQTAPKTPELAIESVDDLEDHSLRLSDLLDEVTPSM